MTTCASGGRRAGLAEGCGVNVDTGSVNSEMTSEASLGSRPLSPLHYEILYRSGRDRASHYGSCRVASESVSEDLHPGAWGAS
jgi:hypothetical protein